MNPVLLFAYCLQLSTAKPDTTLKPLIKEVAKLQIYLLPPPEFYNSDTCFRYSQLLILEINKSGKVTGYSLNDYAPDWLKKDVETRKQNGQVNFKKLDSLAAG